LKRKGLFTSGGININASVSHQQKKSEKEEVKKEYSLNIKIHAIQDDMPEGLSRILDILEESIAPKTDVSQIADKQPQVLCAYYVLHLGLTAVAYYLKQQIFALTISLLAFFSWVCYTKIRKESSLLIGDSVWVFIIIPGMEI